MNQDKYCKYWSLLLQRECCSFSSGEYVKAGLERWCYDATEEVSISHINSVSHRERISPRSTTAHSVQVQPGMN